MPCSFGLLQDARSEAGAHPAGPVGVTVTYRYAPLVTDGYGTRVARPVRTASFERGGNGSQLSQRVRPVPGDSGLLGTSPEGSRPPGEEFESPHPEAV
jgi:hypothetical protein